MTSLADIIGLFTAAAASVIALTAVVVEAQTAVLTEIRAIFAALAARFTDDGTATAQFAGVAPAEYGFCAVIAVLAAVTADFIRCTFAALFIAAHTKLVALLTAVIAAVIAVTALLQTVAAVLALVILVVEAIAAAAAVPSLVTVCAVTVFTAVLTAAADPIIAYEAAAVLTGSLFFPRIDRRHETARPCYFHVPGLAFFGVVVNFLFFMQVEFTRSMVMLIPMDMDLRNSVQKHHDTKQTA